MHNISHLPKFVIFTFVQMTSGGSRIIPAREMPIPKVGASTYSLAKFSLKVLVFLKTHTPTLGLKKQESPPAWTQEAYRPWRIKYSICYMRWGTPPGRGTPQPDLMGGTLGGVSPAGVPPSQVQWGRGYLRRVPLLARSDRGGGTQGGVPPSRGSPQLVVPPLSRSDWGGTWGGIPPGRGTPQLDLVGVPPHLDLAGVTPPPAGVDRQTDACQNKTFPSYYVRGR